MNEKPFALRDSTRGDLQAVQTLMQPFIRQELLLPRDDQQLELLLESGFIAVADEEIIGFAAVEVYSTKLAEIQCLSVTKEWQQRGVGKALIQRCIDFACQQGVLELMAISAEEDFLRSCGFDYSLPGQKRALFIQP